MKCLKHGAEAVAICAYCGRALCQDCAPVNGVRRVACSEECGASLVRAERGLELILNKSVENSRASAFYYYICGILSAGASVYAGRELPIPFLIWFTRGCAVAFIAAGIWYSSMSKKIKL